MIAEHIAYYRHLAETVLRAEQNPTSPNDKTFSFLDYGLAYGPSEQWPKTLIKGWAAGQIRMPDEDHGPSEEGMTELFDACRQYLEETGEDHPAVSQVRVRPLLPPDRPCREDGGGCRLGREDRHRTNPTHREDAPRVPRHLRVQGRTHLGRSQYASIEEAQDAYATLMADADYDPDDKVRVVEITTTTVTRDITPSETP